MFLKRGLIKLLNQLTTAANKVKGELSMERLTRGTAEMLRRRFVHLQCEIKSSMEWSGEPLKSEPRVSNCLLPFSEDE